MLRRDGDRYTGSIKKHSHRSQKKEGWELLSEESLHEKCHERCAKYETLHLTEVKECEQQEEKERLLHIEQEKFRAKERAEKEFAVQMTQ